MIGDARNMGAEAAADGEAHYAYFPAAPAEVYATTIAMRVKGEAAGLAPVLRDVALAVDPGLRLDDVATLDVLLRRRDEPMFLAALTVTGVVLIALLLSAAGLYSLMAVAVTRRTREIGIRLALGATTFGVLRARFARAAAQLGIGIILATCSSLRSSLQSPMASATISRSCVTTSRCRCR